jgi:serine/threonine protein kinase
VMEKIEGSLGVVDVKNVDLQQSNLVVTDTMFQVASGMLYLHDMNVAHCDLKSEIILVKYFELSHIGFHGLCES